MSTSFDTCALCPRLCRHACPVAEGTRREAAVPAVIADALRTWRAGDLPDEVAAQAATLCVDCGRCQEVCHLHRPLPEALREARAALLPEPAVAVLGPVEGEGEVVAVEADERPWAAALAARLGRPVARLRTSDGLGGALVGFSGFEARARRLRERLAGRRVVIADGASARALQAAGVPFAWLHDEVDSGPARASCALGAEDCCGGAWPLVAYHPDDAARMARRHGAAADLADARCRAWLTRCGLPARDVVDRLLEGG